MKRKITSLFLVAGSMFTLNAQILLQENFTSPFNPSTNGWSLQNLSAGTPTTTWFQGNGAGVFPAYNGGPDDYVGANFNSTNSQAAATISNWLITPTVNLVNGAVLEFATRTVTNPAQYADRLEVYLSTAGTGTNVGNTTTSVGTFSTLLVSVNPNLSLTGYPGVWTVYTATITGLAGPTLSRIGFRYHVPSGGPNGSNSDYIGLDAVKVSNGGACAGTVQNYTICQGGSATLTPMNITGTTTYTWNPGNSNSANYVVSPSSTTTYTLGYTENGTACPTLTSMVTIGSQLSVSITASSGTTICSGSNVTLTANAAASTFSWSTGATTNTIAVNPTVTTTYSVGALNLVPFCAGGNTITLNVLPRPSLSLAIAPTLICAGTGSLTLTAAGANTYTFLASSSNPQTIATPTAAGTYSFLVGGTGTNGCTSIGARFFTVNPTPTVSAVASATLACTNTTVMLTGSGADTYTWSSANSPTVNPLTVGTGSTAGTHTYNVVGSNSVGCTSSSQVVAITVTVCNSNPVGIMESGSMVQTSIYPNPFTSEIRINELEGKVEVYNAIGQMVLVTDVTGSTVIKTTDFAKGVYVVKAYNTSGELVKTSKLMKN